jgi:glycosyltransferase involved in cell wall biosynthesis
MNLAFHFMGGPDWPAGEITLEMMSGAIRSVQAADVRLLLSVWENKPLEDYKHLIPLFDDIITLPADPQITKNIQSVLMNSGADAYFSIPTRTAPFIDIPLLLWIYDFQHKHHPSNFTIEERAHIDRCFSDGAQSARRVLVKSESIFADVNQFLPNAIDKTRIVHFEPHIPRDIVQKNPRDICQYYGLPERFIYLPNQFKPYKNHRNVLAALSILSQKGIHPVVVCTGGSKGDFVKQLIQERDESGLCQQFIVAGLLPRNDALMLLRQSVAMLNPSSFEGFGLSVVEAKAFGKPMILSDLPVFREHHPRKIHYFPVNDVAILSQHIAEIWESSPAGPSNDESACLELWQTDQQKFGQRLIELFKETIVDPENWTVA